MYVLPSEPDSNAGHDPGVVDVPGPCATLVRRSAVGTLPDDADIGSELPMELVAQADTGFDLAKSAADSNRRIVLAPGFAIDEPLAGQPVGEQHFRSEEPTSELQSLMRISYAVFCLKK